MQKPDWIRGKISSSESFKDVLELKKSLNLHTICEEGSCPNLGECWSKKHAAFIAMGDICTRACTFCNVKSGKPKPLDPFEPYNIAEAVLKMNLKHVVITSVDRDDLEDGGASHFAKIIECIRHKCKNTTIEILTPDFKLQKEMAIEIIMSNPPDIFNHNIETVPSLYRKVRPIARYFNSLSLLSDVKKKNPNVFTKSGFMVGLGETDDQVIQLMDDLRSADVDFITIGQYLQPTPQHAKVDRYVEPEKFKIFEEKAYKKGFLMVSASPMTRSSYHADEDFEKLRQRRK